MFLFEIVVGSILNIGVPALTLAFSYWDMNVAFYILGTLIVAQTVIGLLIDTNKYLGSALLVGIGSIIYAVACDEKIYPTIIISLCGLSIIGTIYDFIWMGILKHYIKKGEAEEPEPERHIETDATRVLFEEKPKSEFVQQKFRKKWSIRRIAKMSVKKAMLIIVFGTLVVIESFFLVPYHEIQVFRSKQNVPHIEIVGSGYATIEDINFDNAVLVGNASSNTGSKVNGAQLFVNLFITVVSFGIIYFFMNKRDSVNKQNQQLRQSVDSLKNQNTQLKNTIVALREKNQQLVADMQEINEKFQTLPPVFVESEPSHSPAPPHLNLERLVYEDGEEIRKKEEQYAEAMYRYIKARMNEEEGETPGQTSLFDI